MENKLLYSFGIILIFIGALLLLIHLKSFAELFKKPTIVEEYKNESGGTTAIFHVKKLRISFFWGVGFIIIGLITIIFIKYRI
jgi:hypothetical protein